MATSKVSATTFPSHCDASVQEPFEATFHTATGHRHPLSASTVVTIAAVVVLVLIVSTVVVVVVGVVVVVVVVVSVVVVDDAVMVVVEVTATSHVNTD